MCWAIRIDIMTASTTWLWYGGIILVLILQWLLWPNFGTTDTASFIELVTTQEMYGLQMGYKIFNLYYPPFSSVIVYPISLLTDFNELSRTAQTYWIKGLVAFFYYSFVLVMAWWLRVTKHYSGTALAKQIFFLLCNVAIFQSAVVLGYFDIFLAIPLLLAFMCVHKNYWLLAGICLAIAFMTKPVPLLLVPAFIIYTITLKQHSMIAQWKQLFLFLVGLSIVVLPLIWYFTYEQVDYVMTQLSAHGNQLSNAFNLPRLWQLINHGVGTTSPLVHNVSRASFFLISALLLTQLWRSPKQLEQLLYTSIGIIFTYFMVFTGVHENHLFMAIIPALLLYVWQPNQRTRLLYYGLTASVFLNIVVPYGLGYNEQTGQFMFSLRSLASPPVYDVITLCISALIAIFYCWFLWQFFRLPPASERLGSLQ